MANQSLYRKYRPQTFADVVGQEHIEQTLRNALANDRVSHAYLFCGPRGTGKTTTARLLAKALLCDQAPTANPDGTCENCTAIAQGTHPDVYELDAASRTGVDNVREEIIGRVAFSPTRGRFKVYIIDEVHMLSTAAFNALLKTLEEPPGHVVFVLCTTDPQKVPATIISRCQRFDFHKLANEQIAECLVQICEGEGFTYEPGAISLIAEQANGGMRDAITGLEQVAVFGNGNVTYAAAENMFGELDAMEMTQIVERIAARDVAGCFDWVSNFARSGIDVAQVAQSLTAHVRNLYVALAARDHTAFAGVTPDGFEELRRQAALFGSPDRLASMLIVLGDLSTELRSTADARLSLEIALTRMAHPVADLTLESLAARIAALESGAMPVAAPGAVQAAAPVEVQPAVAPMPAPAPAEPQPVAPVPAPVDAPAPMDAPGVAAPAAPVAAQPAAAPNAAPSEGDVAAFMRDPSSLRRMWDAAISMAAKGHPMLPSLLGGARPHADLRESKIVVELPADAGFALGALTDPELKADILDALAKSFGGKLGLEYSLGAPAQSPAPAPAPVPQPQPAPAPAPAPVFEPQPAPAPAPAVEPVPQQAAAPVFEAQSAPAPMPEPPMQPEPVFGPTPIEVFDATPAFEPEPAFQPEPQPAPAPAPQPQAAPQQQAAPSDEEAMMFLDVFGDAIKFTDIND
ncbi:MAG: DNA polymerase III subunit gamma/tau [Coriobacteriales bacterium]|jgi:DNA polymerase-3 subunit gamma/tau